IFGLYLRHWFSNPKMAKRFNRGCSLFLAASGVNLLLSKQ
ncbi:LysE family translocator, partial [Vibrio diabolicus]